MDQHAIPHPEDVHREIAVWNPAKQRWERGRRLDFFVPAPADLLRWSNVLPATDVPPDHDQVIEILYAQRLTVQGDSAHPLNATTDIDLNIETSVDGAVWDTIPYVQRNWGDTQIKTILVEVGPAFIRLRLDNNLADQVVTDVTEDVTGTTEALVATHVIDPPGAIRLISVELDALVADGTGYYRITTQRAGEAETDLVTAQTISNATYSTFTHAVTVDSDVPLTVRFYTKHNADATTNTISSKNYDATSKYKATFIARLLHVD